MRVLPRRLAYGEEATLVEHLGELRTRLVIALLSLAVGFAVAYAFRGHVLHWLNAPLPARLHKPVTFGVAEPFITSVWVSLFGEHQQRVMTSLVGAAAALLVGGVCFGYFVALPAAVKFLTSYDSSHYTILIRARDYYSFCAAVLLAVGLVFEVPVFMLGLVRLGVLSAAQLRDHWRIGLAAMAVIAVALPGVDPVTTTLEMIPLMVLYGLTIAVATLFERREARRAEVASIGEP